MAIRPEWKTDLEPLRSKLGVYTVKRGKRVLAQEIESLDVVKTSLDTKFSQVDSLAGEDPSEQAFVFQGAFLIQLNHSHDQYYLELQTLRIHRSRIHKQSETDRLLCDSSGKGIFSKLDYETDREETFIARMCNRDGNLTFMALNSSYIFYTKLFFVKGDEA